MMVRFVMRKHNYNYSVSSNNAVSEQAIVDVDIPESVQRMLQDGYICERIGVINDATNAISNVNVPEATNGYSMNQFNRYASAYLSNSIGG